MPHIRLCLGGTFNPPHLAHFAIARAALKAFEHVSPELFLIPSGQPAQKPHVVSAQHRLHMLEYACENDARLHLFDHKPVRIQIDPIELRDTHPSFTYQTVKNIHKTAANVQLIWVIGEDQLWNFSTWHRYHELIQSIHLAVATRPGFTEPLDFKDSEWGQYVQAHTCHANDSTWQHHAGGWIISFPAPKLHVSSSTIREALRFPEQNMAFLQETLSPDVLRYIMQQHLYQS